MFRLFLIALALVTSTNAYADVTGIPEDDAGVSNLIREILQAVQVGEWVAVTGLALMITIFILRKTHVLDRLPLKVVPWFSVAMGVVGSFAIVLAQGGPYSAERLLDGVLIGLTATGFWELLGKTLRKEDDDTALEE